MKPAQPRRTSAYVQRVRPTGQNDFRIREHRVALGLSAFSLGLRMQVTLDGESGPGGANFSLKPATGIDELDPGIHRPNARLVFGRCWGNAENDQLVRCCHNAISEGVAEL